MSEAQETAFGSAGPAGIGPPDLLVHLRAMELAGRLGALLGADHPSAAFLATLSRRAPDGLPAGGAGDPLDALGDALELRPAQRDIVIMALAAGEHEGLAAVLRELNPTGAAAPTVGLVAALAEAGQLPGAPDQPIAARLWATALLRTMGLIFDPRGSGDTAGCLDAERTLRLPPGLADALRGRPEWPCGAIPLPAQIAAAVPIGMCADEPDVRTALLACARGLAVTVVLDAGDPLGAAARTARLFAGTGALMTVLEVGRLDTATVAAIGLTALARRTVPILVPTGRDEPTSCALPLVPADLPGPILLAPGNGWSANPSPRPVLKMTVPPYSAVDRGHLWRTVGADCPAAGPPASAGLAVMLAAARDAGTSALLRGTAVAAAEIRGAAESYLSDVTPEGVQRRRPTATWDDLVLPASSLGQIREAVDRIRHHDTVLKRWGFLAGRQGRHGLRLLFSGPPGTGKTLAAEVLAAAVGLDLLVVDLSRMVSKWLGETEKNLASAFDAGTRGEAVLLFDEADVLFGRRTEVGDARDRYANLETAYLLGRLSFFDGIAILATNLRQNLDQAFTRRLEFVVAFDDPAEAERRALWRRHLPEAAPLADDVDLNRLAALYPVTGAVIRNASVAAAYLAARDDLPIGAHHLSRALRREYAKAGRAFPTVNPAGRPHSSPSLLSPSPPHLPSEEQS